MTSINDVIDIVRRRFACASSRMTSNIQLGVSSEF